MIWCSNVLISSVFDSEIRWNSDNVLGLNNWGFDVVTIVGD